MKTLSVITALLGAAAVACGAFGAHALKDILSAHEAEIYNKAVLYQFLHVLAAISGIILYRINPARTLYYAVLFFVTGILLFSGSLYMLTWVLHQQMSGVTFVAILTPFGGLSFIGGWLCLFFYFIKQPAKK